MIYLRFHIILFFTVASAAIFLTSCSQEPQAAAAKKPVQAKIQASLDAEFITDVLQEFNEMPPNTNEVIRFYRENNNLPVWYEKYAVLPQAQLLYNEVKKYTALGFDTANIPLEFILQNISSTIDTSSYGDEDMLKNDILLTDLFYRFAGFTKNGLAEGEQPLESWNIPRERKNISKLLKQYLSADPQKVSMSLVYISHPQYIRLENVYKELEKIEKEGGWPYLSVEGKLEKGMEDGSVATLRERLAVTGELESRLVNVDKPAFFDEELVVALKYFQRKNGLDADGVLGGKTLQALNVTVEQRKKQVLVNIERWKWLPEQWEDKYIFVNIPAFQAFAYNNEKLELQMKVITGLPSTVTPIFKDTIEYIVASPYWNVPFSISSKEILPHLKKDPGYLNSKHMELWSGGNQIDPFAVDWSKVTAKNFNYTIRQKPGTFNAMGLVKFMFPNKYSVYMHDTNARELFNRSDRTMSHGCVRVSKPVEFAEFLLQEQPEWSRDSIVSAMNKGKQKIIPLKKRVPVYITYFTVWVDDDGTAHFYRDPYWRDQEMIHLLFRTPAAI